jgi:hypothetical protein
MDSIFGAAFDIGTRNLGVCGASITGKVPEFDKNWIIEYLKNPDKKPDITLNFLKVEFLARVDLAMEIEKKPVTRIFATEKIKKIVQENSNKKTVGSYDITKQIRQITLEGMSVDENCDKLIPRDGFYDKVYGGYDSTCDKIVDSFVHKITQPAFSWIFENDYPVFIEPQMDHINHFEKPGDNKQQNKKQKINKKKTTKDGGVDETPIHRDPAMWMMSHVIRSTIRTYDFCKGIFDNNRHPCRIIAYSRNKYGLFEGLEHIITLEKYDNMTERQQYDTRKRTMVTIAEVILWKTGNEAALNWLKRLKTLTKPDSKADDISDAIGIFILAIQRNWKVAREKDLIRCENQNQAKVEQNKKDNLGSNRTGSLYDIKNCFVPQNKQPRAITSNIIMNTDKFPPSKKLTDKKPIDKKPVDKKPTDKKDAPLPPKNKSIKRKFIQSTLDVDLDSSRPNKKHRKISDEYNYDPYTSCDKPYSLYDNSNDNNENYSKSSKAKYSAAYPTMSSTLLAQYVYAIE